MFQDSQKTLEPSPATECIEKRRTPRFEADCFVAVNFHDERVIGNCIDWSSNGLGVLLETELPVGEIFWIELPVSGDVPLKVSARVAHQTGSRHGLEFVGLEDRDREMIETFFRQSTGTSTKSGICRSRFGHVIRRGACIFCDFQPPEE